MFEIDWSSDDGRRERYKASTIHGWLVKMRGTLIGSEHIRQAGRREMKEAAAQRAYHRQRDRAAPAAPQDGGYSLVHISKRPSHAPARHAVPLPRRESSHSHHRHRSEPVQYELPAEEGGGGQAGACPSGHCEAVKRACDGIHALRFRDVPGRSVRMLG
ncbi:hypothetical protein BV25DRAFT_1596567 [Artomyces pyxidatus]|uniref:Uncharacterized protein n=1 Tax=Artomyces pyxidatus TaxID=48021 RepID=A0ACB8TCJ1_9AGAM|nr:hypothetical protein BV25DRAFT_1596567 [Artomyces pyxidatus]